jgi:hypothetical protein
MRVRSAQLVAKADIKGDVNIDGDNSQEVCGCRVRKASKGEGLAKLRKNQGKEKEKEKERRRKRRRRRRRRNSTVHEEGQTGTEEATVAAHAVP